MPCILVIFVKRTLDYLISVRIKTTRGAPEQKNNIFSRTYRELAIVFENEIYDCFFHRELIIIANCLTQVLIIGWLPFQKKFFSLKFKS